MFLTYFIRFVTKSPLSPVISVWELFLRTQLVQLFGVNKIVFPLVSIAVLCTTPHWVFDEFLLLGGPSFFCEYAEDPYILSQGGRCFPLITFPWHLRSLSQPFIWLFLLCWHGSRTLEKEKVVLLQGTFYSLLGKVNMTQCQERKFFIQIKRMNICLLLLIVKTHLMVLLYFVFLRSSNYFRKSDFLKPDLPQSFCKEGLFFPQKN